MQAVSHTYEMPWTPRLGELPVGPLGGCGRVCTVHRPLGGAGWRLHTWTCPDLALCALLFSDFTLFLFTVRHLKREDSSAAELSGS